MSMSTDAVRVLKGDLNRLMHRRDKTGVALELQIITVEPLPAALYKQIADVVAALDNLFGDIPSAPPDEGAS